jgi:uncharacterized protein YprB with RNaseH-like and TPR domain
MRVMLTAACLAALVSGAHGAQTDAAQSPELVKQLVTAMAAQKLDAIAAVDPADANRFVAALAFPDVQLLVVSARHRSADYLKAQIAKKEFRDVYTTLQDGVATDRLLFHDMGCDGFKAEGDTVDVMYEGNDKKTMLDGKWEEQLLSEAEYLAKRNDAEEKYIRALTVLLDAVKRLRILTEP